jgi:hypothetical protein
MQQLAIETSLRVKIACAALWPGTLLYSSLIHLAFLMAPVGSLFTSSTSLMCISFDISKLWFASSMLVVLPPNVVVLVDTVEPGSTLVVTW